MHFASLKAELRISIRLKSKISFEVDTKEWKKAFYHLEQNC
jgi:hypothetical protein